MSRRDEHDPFAALILPAGVQAQAAKLLASVARASTAADCKLAAQRADGFVLGLETAHALNAASIEALYILFENAEMARALELER